MALPPPFSFSSSSSSSFQAFIAVSPGFFSICRVAAKLVCGIHFHATNQRRMHDSCPGPPSSGLSIFKSLLNLDLVSTESQKPRSGILASRSAEQRLGGGVGVSVLGVAADLNDLWCGSSFSVSQVLPASKWVSSCRRRFFFPHRLLFPFFLFFSFYWTQQRGCSDLIGWTPGRR